MTQETETYSAGTSFGEFLDDTLSGANTVSEHFPEPPSDPSSSDAAGAPPVEPSDASGANPTSPEGATPTTSTGDPAATPDAPSLEPSAAPPGEPDPLKDAMPLTYTVNGQQRTFDDIKVIPGVGAVIEASALEHLTRRLSERDNLFERSQQQYEQAQALERLMTWTQTVDGKPQELTGPQALEAQRVQLGRSLAALETLTSALNDPDTFASLVALDANNNVVLNQHALQHLATRSELNELNAERMVRQHWATLNAAPQPQSASLNIEQVTPHVITHYVTQYGGDGVLNEDDKQFLSDQLSGYLREPTPEEIRQNPALRGDKVVDTKFDRLVQREIAKQKGAVEQTKQAGSIAKENAARLGAALLPNGKAPSQSTNTQTRPVTRQTPKPPSHTQADRDDLFLKMERAAAGAM